MTTPVYECMGIKAGPLLSSSSIICLTDLGWGLSLDQKLVLSAGMAGSGAQGISLSLNPNAGVSDTQ